MDKAKTMQIPNIKLQEKEEVKSIDEALVTTSGPVHSPTFVGKPEMSVNTLPKFEVG